MNQKLKFLLKLPQYVFSFQTEFQTLKIRQKTFEAKMPRWLVFSEQTLEPSCSDTKCYELNTKIAQKIQNKYSMNW